MIFKLIPVAFVIAIFYLSQNGIFQAADNYDSSIYDGLEDVVDLKTDINIDDINTSSSYNSSIGSVRKERESSSKKIRSRQLKYHNAIKPLQVKINDATENVLREKEKEMEANGRTFFWDKYNELDIKQILSLCANAWNYLKPHTILEDIILTDDMIPDCDAAFILGPSIKPVKGRRYLGHFQYLPNLKNKLYFADFLRCNCAYLQYDKYNDVNIIVNKSKTFFYILKFSKQFYFILTVHGETSDRCLKIVNVYNHIID